MTSVSDVLDTLVGNGFTTAVKAAAIVDAIFYLSGLGITATDGGDDSTDMAIALLAQRMLNQKMLYERGVTDQTLLAQAISYNLMTDEIERLLNRDQLSTNIQMFKFVQSNSNTSSGRTAYSGGTNQ